jgi:hypothetical protein
LKPVGSPLRSLAGVAPVTKRSGKELGVIDFARGGCSISRLVVADGKTGVAKGEYQKAYEGFQHGYFESFWLLHLDLAYTLPFLGRIDGSQGPRSGASQDGSDNDHSRSARFL